MILRREGREKTLNETYVKGLFGLDGKRAVVTGASSGIGRGVAVSLANFGAKVALLGRNPEGLKETERLVKEAGGVSESCIVDVSDQAAVDRFYDEYFEKHGGVDILVANAGVNIRGEYSDTTMAEVDTLFNTNFKGVLYQVLRAGEAMKKQRSGNIVIMSSINGISAMPNLAIYSSVKYALEGLTRAVAGSLAEYGVRVNSCAPGVVLTAINEKIYAVEENLTKKMEAIPMRKIGYPKDIGDTVAAMVSDAFGFMTGATVLVDGGEHLRAKQPQAKK